MMEPITCYRCRSGIVYEAESITCAECCRSYHLDCLLQPIDEETLENNDWLCPQHNGKSYMRRYKLVKRKGNIVKVKQPQEDITFPEADKVVDYGGIAYNVKSSEIENAFLNYARKYRTFQSSQSKEHNVLEASEWVESIQKFQLLDLSQLEKDGIQMLLDAANMDDSLSISSHSSTGQEEDIPVDNNDYERYQAIEELIRLKGQDKLLSLLK